MKRAYLIGGILLAAGVIVSAIALLTNRITIPDGRLQDAHLRGRLVLASGDGVTSLDLVSGAQTTLFKAEPKSALTAAAISPDGKTLAISYAPPAALIQFGYTNLYTLPADGSGGLALMVDGHGRDVITGPVWSADGKHILYTRSGPSADGMTTTQSVEEIGYPAGGASTMVKNGFAPDVSADGTKLVYVTLPEGAAGDSLMIAGMDGSQAAEVAGEKEFLSIDRPRISPDGTLIAFSGDAAGMSQGRAGLDWAEALGGVRVASAHTIPTSDIWAIPAAGGTPVRLIKLLASGIALGFAPDGKQIAFVTTQGVYVMGNDGSGAVRILQGDGYQTVMWVGE